MRSFIKKLPVIRRFVKMNRQLNDLMKANAKAIKKIEKQSNLIKKQAEQISSLQERCDLFDATKRDLSESIQNADNQLSEFGGRIEGLDRSVRDNTDFMHRKAWELAQDSLHYYYRGLDPSRYEHELGRWFLKRTGEKLNLENPETFNQKINYLKLRGDQQLMANLTDKYAVKDYVAKRIGDEHVVPTYGMWERAADIDFDSLPEKFVLKCTHGCEMNIICKSKEHLDIDDAKWWLQTWLDTDFAFRNGFEMQYHYINPRIIAEEYLDSIGEVIDDYKVYCFDGKAKYIHYLTDRDKGLRMAYYDLDWNYIRFKYAEHEFADPVPKPENLDELIALCEKLAKGISFVRMDFYYTTSKEWKFGEMTFTPASGAIDWDPPEWNKKLGDLIDINQQ
jgi:hypothetical protein